MMLTFILGQQPGRPRQRSMRYNASTKPTQQQAINVFHDYEMLQFDRLDWFRWDQIRFRLDDDEGRLDLRLD